MTPSDLNPSLCPQMTKNEREFESILVGRHGRDAVVFGPIVLRLRNGHRYSPDFLVFGPGWEVTAYEVKGSYKLHSYARARMAFDQASLEWPWWRWVWAEKQLDGTWVES